MPVNVDWGKSEKQPYGATHVLYQDEVYGIRYRTIKPRGVVPLQHHTHSRRFFYVLRGFGMYTDNEGVVYAIRGGDRFSVRELENFSFIGSPNSELVLIETYVVEEEDEVVIVNE